MTRLVVSIVLSIAVLTGFALLPAVPGAHDSVAVSLSALAQALAWLSLGFVPIGALWLASVGRKSAAWDCGFGLATASVASIVLVATSGLALAAAGPSLAVLLLLAGTGALLRAWARMLRWNEPPAAARALAAYLVLVPVSTLLLQQLTLVPALDHARARAIANAAPLIAGIRALSRDPQSLSGIAARGPRRLQPRPSRREEVRVRGER